MRRLVGGVLLACLVAIGPAAAQLPGSGAHDASQPVQISADSLDVQQDNRIATFKGNVEAMQGEMRLKADQVRVHYRDQKSGGGSAQSGAIHRLEAVGHVFISRPNETARGDRGTYDLEKRVIVLDGNVVLTSGENVLRGNRATLDLQTRQSTVDNAPGTRVQGVFKPQ